MYTAYNHPRINAAIREQLERAAHTSFLGTTNPPAIELAREIVKLFPEEKFGRVFYSDDGSTGMEAALRIVRQYWKLKGSKRRTFISFRARPSYSSHPQHSDRGAPFDYFSRST